MKRFSSQKCNRATQLNTQLQRLCQCSLSNVSALINAALYINHVLFLDYCSDCRIQSLFYMKQVTHCWFSRSRHKRTYVLVRGTAPGGDQNKQKWSQQIDDCRLVFDSNYHTSIIFIRSNRGINTLMVSLPVIELRKTNHFDTCPFDLPIKMRVFYDTDRKSWN